MYFMQLFVQAKQMINRAKTSFYDKNKVFVKLHKESENIEEIYFNENNLLNFRLTIPFIEKKRDTDHSDLYIELLHTDIADLRFVAKSAVNPKYCLLKKRKKEHF